MVVLAFREASEPIASGEKPGTGLGGELRARSWSGVPLSRDQDKGLGGVKSRVAWQS